MSGLTLNSTTKNSSNKYDILYLVENPSTVSYSDQQILDKYYSGSETAHTKILGRTWLYNPGLKQLYFYKYIRKSYLINSKTAD